MEQKTQKRILIMLGLIFAVLLLSNLSAVLLPFSQINSIMTPIYIGFIIAFLLNPLMKLFERKVYFKMNSPKLIRIFSILSAYIVFAGIITGFVFIIVPQIKDSVNDIIVNGSSYADKAIALINSTLNKLNIKLIDGDITLEVVIAEGLKLLESVSDSIFAAVSSAVSSTIDIIKNILVGIFVSVYVLLSKERIAAGTRRLVSAIFTKKTSESVFRYASIANKKFGGYVVGNMLDCVFIGVEGFIVFSIFNIPYAPLIALICGVTNFIPFFGPFIGAIPSAFIILIADPSKVITFIIIILIMQQIDGNLIQPKIIGDQTGLSSLGVITAITLMGGIFGFAGLVIGAPLTAMLIIMADDIIRERLQSKGHPSNIEDYYDTEDLIKPGDKEENIFVRLYKKIFRKKTVEEKNEDSDGESDQQL